MEENKRRQRLEQEQLKEKQKEIKLLKEQNLCALKQIGAAHRAAKMMVCVGFILSFI